MADVWGIDTRKVGAPTGLARTHAEHRQSDNGDVLTPQRGPTAPFITPQEPPPWTSASGALLRQLHGRSADGGWFELDSWGNGFLQLESGGTIILGAQTGTRASSSCRANADRRRHTLGTTAPRPISLGEVLAWRRSHQLGIALPAAAGAKLALPPRSQPATAGDDRTVLSAAEGERFIVVHGDNYGCIECRAADGSWRPTETVAEYLPAGADRRYVRRVGEAYGEFQRRNGNGWESECPGKARRQRLYLIDGRFEVLNDAEYERRHGSMSSGTLNAWPLA